MPSKHRTRPLVRPHSHISLHIPLTRVQTLLEIFSLRREIRPVVERFAPSHSHELISQRPHLPIQHQPLQIHMRLPQHRQSWRLIAAPTLQPNKPVLHNVNPPYPMPPCDLIRLQKQRHTFRDTLLPTTLHKLEFARQPLLKPNGELFRRIRRLPRIHRQLPHLLQRRGVRLLEHPGLVRAVRKVLVHTPGRSLGARHGNPLRRRIVQQRLPTGKALVECGVPPRRDDLDVRLEGVERQLEPHLVIALARAAVADSKAPLSLGDCDLRTRDYGPREGSPKEIDALIDSVARDGWVAELVDKFFPEVDDVDRGGADLEGFGADGVEVFFLTNVSAETDNFKALLL